MAKHALKIFFQSIFGHLTTSCMKGLRGLKYDLPCLRMRRSIQVVAICTCFESTLPKQAIASCVNSNC